ncbi:DUF3837 family protein [Lachnospiraceae bacterium YH-ros2226]
MVPYVVKMAVDMKVSKQESTLVGNYEYYYAAGRLASILKNQELREDLPPHELEAKIRETLSSWQPETPEDKYLAYLLDRYEAEDDYQDDVKKMFQIGKGTLEA